MANGQIKFNVGFNVDKSSLNSIKSAFNDLRNLKLADFGGNIDQLRQIKTLANELEKELEEAFNPTLGTVNLTKFNESIKNNYGSIGQLRQEFLKAGDQGSIAFQKMANSLLSTNTNLKQSHMLLDKMATTMSNTLRWTVASSAINAVTSSIQKAYSYTVELDTALNDIRIVTEKSAEEMDKFAIKANNAAKALGASTKAYTEASLIYYQQGLSDEEVAARSEVTLKAANVTGQNANTVSEQLTAVWNGYKVSAKESEMYIDKLAAVAASTAADLEELSVGMSKVASAANIMGVDIDQLNAQLATIVSVTREAPESIGTALKTVYARMSDLEAGLDSETTLGEYTKQMAMFGINALNTNGKLRDMGDVIEEIGAKWEGLNRNQQVALAQTIAGTRQYSRMMALFDNWDMYEEALATSANSLGTLQKQQDIYMESTEAHLQRLSTQAEELYTHLFDTDSIEDVVDGLGKVLDGVDTFVQAMGGGIGVLKSLAPLMLLAFGPNLARGISTAVHNIQGMVVANKNLAATKELVLQLGVEESALDKKAIEFKERQLELGRAISKEEHDNLTKQIAGYTELTIKLQEIEALEKRRNQEFEKQGQKFNLQGESIDDQAANLEMVVDNANQVKLGQVNSNNLADFVTQVQTLRNAFQEGTSEAEALDKALAQIGDGQDIGKIENLQTKIQDLKNAFEKAKISAKKGATQLRKTSTEISDLGTQADETKRKIESMGDALNQKLKSFDLSKTLTQFSAIASKASMTAMAVQTIMQLESIWNNDDITTGEKLLQTIINVSMAASMMIPTILALVGAIQKYKKAQTESLTVDTAKIFTGRKVNKEYKEQIINQIINAQTTGSLTEEKKKEIIARIKNGQSISKENKKLIEQNVINNAGSGGKTNIFGKIKAGGKNFIGGAKAGLKGGAKAASTAGTAGAAKVGVAAGTALKGVVGALSAVPVWGWIAAAAIVAVTAATVAITAERNKEKKALEAAKVEQEKMTKSLTEAQQAFASAKSTLDGYKSIKKSFDDLTKGTSEWNNALVENNAKVLELLGAYPELNEFLSRNADGILEITDAGLAMVQATEQAKLIQAQEAKIVADQRVREKQLAYDSEIFLRQQGFDTLAGVQDKYKEDLKTILQKADLDRFLKTGKLQDENGKNITGIESELISALQNETGALIKLQEQLEENNRLMAIEQSTLYQDKLIAKGVQAEEASLISGLMAADQLGNNYTLQGKTKEEWIANKAAEYRKKPGSNKDLIKDWAEAKGIDYKKIKQVGGGNFKYVDADGNTQKISYDTLAEDLANFDFNNQALEKEQLEKYREKIATINKSLVNTGNDVQAKSIAHTVLSSNTALDVDDIENYSAKTIQNLKKMTADTTLNLSNTAKKAILETITNLETNLRDFTKNKGWDDAVDEFVKKVGGVAEDGLMEMETQLATKYGETAQQFLNAGGATSLQALEGFLGSLGESANAFIEGVNWNSETLTEDIIKAYEDTGKEWDMTSDACYNMLRAVEDLNGGILSSRENFKELAEIVDSLDTRGDTISAEEFAKLRTQYGNAIDSYFTQMQDGTYALIGTAKEFKNLTTSIYKQQIEKELAALESEFKDFNSAVDTIKNTKVEKLEVLDEAKFAAAKVSAENEGVEGHDKDYWESGRASQEEAQAMLKAYLKTSEGAGMLTSMMSGGWFGSYYEQQSASALTDAQKTEMFKKADWNAITQQTGGNTLQIDLFKGINYRRGNDTKSIDYADLYDAIMAEKISDLDEKDYKIESYNETSMKSWIAQLQNYDLLSKDKANEFTSRAQGDNLKIVNGTNELMDEIKAAISESTAEFDKDKATEVVSKALLAGLTEDDIKKIMPSVYDLVKDQFKDLAEKAADAIALQKTQEMLEDYESQLETIEKINAEYEQMNSFLEQQRELIKLTTGEDNYEGLKESYESSITAINGLMMNNQNSMNHWATEMSEALAGKDKERYEAAKANWEEAASAYYNSWSQKIELLKEQEINAINAVFKARENATDKYHSLDYMSQNWELSKTKSDLWLDDVNAAYGISEVRSKYNKALTNTSDINAQKQIRNLMEDQLDALEKQDKLSEYDLKRAEAKLTVLEKEIALRDAQNNKTKMQLVRGADGTYSYQYVADAAAMISAEEELAKAQNELYNIDLDEYKSNLDSVLQYYEQFKSDWLEANDEVRAVLEEQYFGEDGILTLLMGEDNKQILKNIGANYKEIFGGLFGEGSDLQSWIENFKPDQLLTELKEIPSAQDSIKDATDALNTSLDDTLTTVQKIADTMAKATWNKDATLTLTSHGFDAEALSQAIVTGLQTTITNMVLVWEEGTEDTKGKFKWVASAATGAYTGEWGSEGRFIQVHEKELILNKQDTANILQAVDLVRSMKAQLEDSLLQKILDFESNLGTSMSIYEAAKSGNLEQNVHITAEFPNVNTKAEIEEAFKDIINLATQYAAQNKK